MSQNRNVIITLAFVACAAPIAPISAKAADYRQCNVEVIQKKDSFNVSLISAQVVEKLAKTDKWTKAFEASDADRIGAVMALMVDAVWSIAELTERPRDGDYVRDVAINQVMKVSEAIASTKLSMKIAAKGDPKLLPLLALGAGLEAGKAIGDSIAIITSASLSSCNKRSAS